MWDGHREKGDQEDAGERRQRGMTAAVKIGGADCRQRVEAQQHPLSIDEHVEEECDDEHRQDEPQLFVYDFEVVNRARSHRMVHSSHPRVH